MNLILLISLLALIALTTLIPVITYSCAEKVLAYILSNECKLFHSDVFVVHTYIPHTTHRYIHRTYHTIPIYIHTNIHT